MQILSSAFHHFTETVQRFDKITYFHQRNDLNKFDPPNYIHRVWQETWDQQILNKIDIIHPSTSHWAALPMRRHDVRLTRLRIGHTRFTHRHFLLDQINTRRVVPHKYSTERLEPPFVDTLSLFMFPEGEAPGVARGPHPTSPSTNLTRGLAARRLFRVPPCRKGTIHLQKTHVFSGIRTYAQRHRSQRR
ncbi:hypothetical protein TNCV_2065051 [Trichonephila clavipes]|nr:hypothetical protein TNCV_2065051 [Trichonephila clavipes]